MIHKVDTGIVRLQCVDSYQRTALRKVITFIFFPGHAGVEGNERVGKLAGLDEISAG